MVSRRIERLQEEIGNRVNRLLRFEVQDPRVRGVTVTRVMLTRDLGLARVYYETGDPADRVMVGEGLEAAKGFIRRNLASGLELKFAPQVEFFYDETREAVQKVEALFSKL